MIGGNWEGRIRMGFLDELKRRNVFRVALAYIVVSWLLLQVGDVLFDTLELGPTAGRLLLAILVLGFLPALVFSWVYELTPDGLRRESEIAASESIAAHTGRRLNLVTVAAVVALLGFMAFDRWSPSDPGTAEVDDTPALSQSEPWTTATDTPPSIAVLPFTDMSQAGDQGYFADGISEEILNVLVRIPGLKVAGRTSSFQFRGDNQDLRDIGQQLGVNHILEGSVRKSGDRARITVQLITASDGFHLWSETYDRGLADIFAIQDEISRAVADALSVRMGMEDQASQAGTADMAAHDLYLRARQRLSKRGYQSLLDAAALFKAATIIDPKYSSAYSGQARALSLLWYYQTSRESTQAAFSEARRAAQKAIELDDTNVEAWSVRGYLEGADGWDWDQAARDHDRAIALNPNDAEVANFAGDFFRGVSDEEKALFWERKALEMDPLKAINHADLAFALEQFGHCEESIVHGRKATEMDPNLVPAWTALAVGMSCLERYEEALSVVDRIEDITGPTLDTLEFRAGVAQLQGKREVVVELARRIEEKAAEGMEADSALALIYVYFGDLDSAAASLTRMIERRDPALTQARIWTLPEHWPDHPGIQAALADPALQPLFELRRRNMARNAGD